MTSKKMFGACAASVMLAAGVALAGCSNASSDQGAASSAEAAASSAAANATAAAASSANAAATTATTSSAASATTAEPAASTQSNTAAQTPSSAASGQAAAPAATDFVITQDEAKATALQHAGVQESTCAYVNVHQDIDDGIATYDVEFVVDTTEYSYDINAQTGDILSFEQESTLND